MADMVELVFVDRDDKGQITGKPYGGKDVGLDGAQYAVVNSRVKVPEHLAHRLEAHGFVSLARHTAAVVQSAADEATARNRADLVAKYHAEGPNTLHGDTPEARLARQDATRDAARDATFDATRADARGDATRDAARAATLNKIFDENNLRDANRPYDPNDPEQDAKDVAFDANRVAARAGTLDANKQANENADYAANYSAEGRFSAARGDARQEYHPDGSPARYGDAANRNAADDKIFQETHTADAKQVRKDVSDDATRQGRPLTQEEERNANIRQDNRPVQGPAASDAARRAAEQSMGPARDANARAEADRRAKAAQADADKKRAKEIAKAKADEAKG